MIPQAGQLARSPRTGRMGKVLIDENPPGTSHGEPCGIAVAIQDTIPQWMTLTDFEANFEIVEPCQECDGSGWVRS